MLVIKWTRIPMIHFIRDCISVLINEVRNNSSLNRMEMHFSFKVKKGQR